MWLSSQSHTPFVLSFVLGSFWLIPSRTRDFGYSSYVTCWQRILPNGKRGGDHRRYCPSKWKKRPQTYFHLKSLTVLLADPVNRQSKWDLLPLLPCRPWAKNKRWRRTRTRSSFLPPLAWKSFLKVDKKRNFWFLWINCELLTTSFAYDVWSVFDPFALILQEWDQPLKWIPSKPNLRALPWQLGAKIKS